MRAIFKASYEIVENELDRSDLFVDSVGNDIRPRGRKRQWESDLLRNISETETY